jgi:NifB/MoaA-like Fe-S oxidoreductase
VLDRFPQLASIGVVPLGVSAHNTEPDMRPHTRADAEAVLDTVAAWQHRFAGALGRRLVHASDEYYLLAGRPFPALADYDGCPQHENGIGMAATFAAEVAAARAGAAVTGTGPKSGFFAWVDGAPATGYRAPRVSHQIGRSGRSERPERPITIVTGEYGAAVLRPLLAELRDDLHVVAVPNRFFGGNIAVTGLLTGADVAAALAGVPEDHRVLLPDVVLSKGRFLDGMTAAALPRAVEIVPTDGAALVAAVAR